MTSMRDFFPDQPKSSRRKRSLTPEELQQWQEVSSAIRPLPRVESHRPKPVHAVKITAADPVHAQWFTHTAPLAALEKRLKQKLLRGRIQVDAKLDLHGFYQDQAQDRMIDFLIEAQRRQNRIVLIVTGKGSVAPASGGSDFHFGEPRTGVLRRLVPQWLRAAELRGLVIGFEEAGPGHGGSGALYVRIRRVERNL